MNKLLTRPIRSYTTKYIYETTSPRKPLFVDAMSGCGTAYITFWSSSNGGSNITNYQYSLDGGDTFNDITPEQIDSPIILDGLTNGKPYNIALRAINENGPGISSEIMVVTPQKRN